MLAVAAFVAAGCVNEEPPYKEEPKPTPGDATGFLSVSGLSMRVVYDETDVRPDDTSDQTQSPQAVSGTRAEQPDVDGFIVEILDADNAQVFKKTYAELKQQLAEPMELPVGAYRMEVRSEESTPDVAWEHPVYGATSSFTISKAQTTQLEEVVCTLQNIKVTVDYSSELAGMLARHQQGDHIAGPDQSGVSQNRNARGLLQIAGHREYAGFQLRRRFRRHRHPRAVQQADHGSQGRPVA